MSRGLSETLKGVEMGVTIRVFTLIVCCVGLFAGCAASTPPAEDMKIAKMAMIDAEKARESPKTSEYFDRARKELAEAQKRLSEKAYEEAKFLAQKTTADARLTKIKAQNAQLEARIEKLEEALRRIRSEFATLDAQGGEK